VEKWENVGVMVQFYLIKRGLNTEADRLAKEAAVRNPLVPYLKLRIHYLHTGGGLRKRRWFLHHYHKPIFLVSVVSLDATVSVTRAMLAISYAAHKSTPRRQNNSFPVRRTKELCIDH
jgi:hypothetical protein